MDAATLVVVIFLSAIPIIGCWGQAFFVINGEDGCQCPACKGNKEITVHNAREALLWFFFPLPAVYLAIKYIIIFFVYFFKTIFKMFAFADLQSLVWRKK